MRNLFIPSALAIAIMTASAFAQEYDDQVMQEGDVMDQPQPVGETFDAYEPDEDVAGELSSEDEADELGASERADPELLRQELIGLIKLPVRDVNEKRIGVVENVVMKDGAPHLVVIKLDNLIPSDKLLRAISSAETVTVDEGAVVALATLTKTEVRKQSAFFYQDAMDTIVPVTNAVKRSDMQSEW